MPPPPASSRRAPRRTRRTVAKCAGNVGGARHPHPSTRARRPHFHAPAMRGARRACSRSAGASSAVHGSAHTASSTRGFLWLRDAARGGGAGASDEDATGSGGRSGCAEPPTAAALSPGRDGVTGCRRSSSSSPRNSWRRHSFASLSTRVLWSCCRSCAHLSTLCACICRALSLPARACCNSSPALRLMCAHAGRGRAVDHRCMRRPPGGLAAPPRRVTTRALGSVGDLARARRRRPRSRARPIPHARRTRRVRPRHHEVQH